MIFSAILIGILCGNLGAVLFKQLNIGLFWNSITGVIGALGITLGQGWLSVDLFPHWSHDMLAAGGAAVVVMLLAGGAVAMRYR
ncbi:MAG: putative membrane protein YeaQ/YmgE (transglycosylase-associated protein family) [Paracoccaceae bacterium]|jgi:uncharacterized membrane protein YeaQ/YmgE (transglycosylase-associated protein family)